MEKVTVSKLNELAQKFKRLHVPGNPIILVNVHDAKAAHTVASHPSCKATATASWAIAASQGVDDDDMTLDQNLQGIRNVVRGVANAGKIDSIPITCDLQDGYQDIKHSIQQAISLGCVGADIEDVDLSNKRLRSIEEATERIRQAVQAVTEAGVPDFVINARTDALKFEGNMADVEERGAAFLAAGATTAFIWGATVQQIDFDDLHRICQNLDGRVSAFGPGPTKLSIDDLRKAGVSRVSLGPYVFRKAMQTFEEEAATLLSS